MYEFDPAAEHLLCSGYAPVLIAALDAAVRAHPEACVIFETTLSSLLGIPVGERSDSSRNPSCKFELRSPKK